MIQAVTFSFPIVGGHNSPFQKGHVYNHPEKVTIAELPGSCYHVIFHPITLLGEDFQFDEYFSDGLVQPPTSIICISPTDSSSSSPEPSPKKPPPQNGGATHHGALGRGAPGQAASGSPTFFVGMAEGTNRTQV